MKIKKKKKNKKPETNGKNEMLKHRIDRDNEWRNGFTLAAVNTVAVYPFDRREPLLPSTLLSSLPPPLFLPHLKRRLFKFIIGLSQGCKSSRGRFTSVNRRSSNYAA